MQRTDHVGVCGSGAMGSGIAQVAAAAGHEVFVYDSSPEALSKARSSLTDALSKLVSKGKLEKPASDDILKRTHFVSSVSELNNCRLDIEAVVENIEVKKKLFAQLEDLVGKDAVLATNTSSLSVASISSALKNPGRFIGIHFFNPAPLMPLVEIIPGILTSPQLGADMYGFMKSWGKVPVLAKDSPGFIVNRVARSYYGESIRIYEEGIADFATIDWAMKEFGGFRMGPFELMDFIGNDINYKVTESVWEQFFHEPRFKPSLTQKRLYEAGLFGRKTGRGYYTYTEGSGLPAPDKNEVTGRQIFKRVLAMLVNEAADSLYLGLATREDLDLAMTKGVNYPKGLLQWADEIGIPVILDEMNSLFTEYGEDRYRPSILLKRLAASGKKFYS